MAPGSVRRQRLDCEVAMLRERLEQAEALRYALIAEQLDGFVVGSEGEARRVVLLETSASGAPALPDSTGDAADAVRAIRAGDIDGIVVGGETVMLMREAQSPYRALVDRMQQGAVSVSLDGDILYANARFAHMVGSTTDALLGKPIHAVLGTDEVLALLTDAHEPKAVELTTRRVDGAPLRVATTAERVDGIDAVTLVLSDLTERDRRRESEERERRNDRFLAVLAHELRNPLGVVGNTLERLARSTTLVGADREAVEVIDRQSHTLMRLVEDLLDVHRLNQDKIVLKRQAVDMREIVERAVEAARPSMAARSQQLEMAMSAEPIHVHADVVRLAQVLGNILLNASKFTQQGGRVHIALHRAVSGTGAQVACVEVTDNGIGIPVEHLESIFEPYVQVPQDEPAVGEGLGLGLSVARRLVALHGGSITAFSEGPGRGTTLRLELPTCAAPCAGAARVARPAPSAPRLRILIVDDDPDSANSLAQLLEVVGHETSIATTGDEALALAETQRPNVVILDIGMPDMDGFAAARALRARPWSRGLVLYALTGWSQAQTRERARKAGFDRHFAKPIVFDELLRDIAERTSKMTRSDD